MFSSKLTLLACVGVTVADVYMHNPRGSNNRLNEQSANRNNGNRMFDSQNNNRGGYNKGDVRDQAAGNAQKWQYDMVYYQSDIAAGIDQTDTDGKTVLSIEWTNQHGCGGNEQGDPHKLNCQIVLQYMCHDGHKTGLEKGGTNADAPQPENGPVDGFRQYCNKECMIPHPKNLDCAPATDLLPGCGLSEIDSPTQCAVRGYKWVDAQINDVYNCPHSCDGTSDNPAEDSVDTCPGTWTPGYAGGNRQRMRDGTTTNRQEFTNPNNGQVNSVNHETERANRKRNNVQPDRGLHESWEWYDECYRRERNKGVFTADQNLRNNNLGYSSAVYTRQNPNNNRRGYECPEERDHFPYWHPSPWTDIAVLTDRLDQCEWYSQESQNVKGKNLCRNTPTCRNCVRYNNGKECTDNGGVWAEVGPWNVPAPKCEQSPWSRVNHLGNGRFGQANTFNWTIPSFGSDENGQKPQQCVVRLRYNISTDDYDAWRVNNSFNQNNGQGIKSPVQQNPAVDVGTVNTALRLAINTAQFGRTFQDRSHVLTFAPRPKTPSTGTDNEECAFSTRHGATKQCEASTSIFKGKTIHNLNVRGKRCNIVQCFPSVEYDFAPNHLHIKSQDLVHIQWTGSNTHNNGNPAGDGQAGDAGEGRRGTDRHNLVELRSRDSGDFGGSFPAPWSENKLFSKMTNAYAPKSTYTCDNNGDMSDKKNAACETSEAAGRERGLESCVGAAQTEQVRNACWERVKRSWAVRMATAGYYNGYDEDHDADKSGYTSAARPEQFNNDAANTQVNNLLNNAPASFMGGVMQFSRGTYNYMNTRNHNFSNRDQKGALIVE